MWFHFRPGCRDTFIHSIQYMESSLTGLFKRFAHRIHTEAVYLDIHLNSTNSIPGSGNFKIHISEMIFIAQDICQNRVLIIRRPGNKTHSHTTYVFGKRNSRVHQG